MVRTTVDSRPAAEHHRQEPGPPDRLSRTPPEPPPRGGAPQTPRNPEQGLEAAEGTSPQHREEQVRQDREPEPPPQVQKQPLWKQVVVSRQEADRWPSHLRVFSSDEEYRLVRHTHLMLQRSGFYWGPMSMESAHRVLNACEPGAFLIRDSGRTDVFFTLSYHRGDDGPTSVRVLLANQLFSLHGSNKTFDSLLGLLAFYTSGTASGRLRRPHRTERPDSLQAICRRALHRAYGAHRSTHLPGLSNPVRDYLQDYPYDI